jgi:glyoxylase-like metal-dependent hydrolase (beta-lactamase superfamily II)
MQYTGDVSAGGGSDQRDLPLLTIRKASVGEMSNNVYLLTCVHTGAQLLIDAADDPARILSLLEEGSGSLETIVTTHQHWDHHRALVQAVEATNATTAAGDADADALPVIPDR